MNRNANSRFAVAPSVNIPRTRMRRPFNNTLTFDCGMLVPFYFSEVLPGQTSKVSTHKVVRTQPLVSAPMQDLFLDTFYFYVPNRLVWTHWKNFMGENTSSPWVPEVNYSIPQAYIDGNTMECAVAKNSLGDYFGLPLCQITQPGEKISVSALYSRAYALIVREFFQSEAVETPINVPLDDNNREIFGTDRNELEPDDQYIHSYGFPYIVNKFHDYFTSALPTPIKSENDVLALPDMPVVPTGESLTKEQIMALTPNDSGLPFSLSYSDFTVATENKWRLIRDGSSNMGYSSINTAQIPKGISVPTNLKAFNSTTIEDLRVAFAVQRLLERDNYGTRYREILRNHFSVVSPDATQQVPQYLGGSRKMLNISQVLQTSESGETPLGNVGGYSLTNDSHYDFEFSSTEHGMIIGLMCVRYIHRYSQGIKRCLSRKNRLDFFWPEFSHLGSQAILKKEIFANGSAEDDDVFGYSEYAADYRFNQDMVCGEMRPEINGGLKSWTFADYYDTHPTLSRDWLKEDKHNLDRALAVTSDVSNQLWANIQVEEVVTLPMPLYSIPALLSNF